MKSRDPSRWRYDAVGNIVCRDLRACSGPFCHSYDHWSPYSKGGKTSSKNCKVLQHKVNLFKSNKIFSMEEL